MWVAGQLLNLEKSLFGVGVPGADSRIRCLHHQQFLLPLLGCNEPALFDRETNMTAAIKPLAAH